MSELLGIGLALWCIAGASVSCAAALWVMANKD